MRRLIILSLILFINVPNCKPQCTAGKTQNYVFDYFRQDYDSIVFVVGNIFLMPGDSLSFKKNDYTIDSTNSSLKICFKGKLLYQYRIKNEKIEGDGFCYYPFLGRVAMQGRFKNSKLDGLVFVYDTDGSMIEVMKYRKGVYKKHIYHWRCQTEKCLKYKSKGRSKNPLRNDEAIIQ